VCQDVGQLPSASKFSNSRIFSFDNTKLYSRRLATRLAADCALGKENRNLFVPSKSEAPMSKRKLACPPLIPNAGRGWTILSSVLP
jgi:hypothetical protein